MCSTPGLALCLRGGDKDGFNTVYSLFAFLWDSNSLGKIRQLIRYTYTHFNIRMFFFYYHHIYQHHPSQIYNVYIYLLATCLPSTFSMVKEYRFQSVHNQLWDDCSSCVRIRMSNVDVAISERERERDNLSMNVSSYKSVKNIVQVYI